MLFLNTTRRTSTRTFFVPERFGRPDMPNDHLTPEVLAESILDLLSVVTQLVVNRGQVHDQELDLRKRLGKVVYALRPPAPKSNAA
jgi:hypothetical protein